jgi:hypothetical protein
MSYYPDLSSYEYSPEGAEGVLNVGWLDVVHGFSRGDVPDVFVDKLWGFCQVALIQARGFHICELCDSPSQKPPIARHGEDVLELGSAQIRVFGKDGRIYAAPNLIYHYVVEHQYCPPEEFIQAVLEGSQPGTPEYLSLLDQCGLEPFPYHGMSEDQVWEMIAKMEAEG